MIQVFETPEFTGWLASLRDDNAHARIVRCIRRMEGGSFGDFKPAGGHGVMETRIDYGHGYRVYYVRRGATDKRTQQKEIKEAQKLADIWKDVPS